MEHNKQLQHYNLTERRPYYKPFTYPWAYNYAEEHRKMNWTKEEVRSMHEDVLDWQAMTPEERAPRELLLLYFTQADWDIGDSYIENLFRWYKMPELRHALIRTVDREATHTDNYDMLPDQFGVPHRNYQALLEVDAVFDQHQFMIAKAEDDSFRSRVLTLAKHIAGEGISVFGIFLMLLNDSRFGRMKCLGQEIVSWSARDENQHVGFLTKLLLTEIEQNPSEMTDDLWAVIAELLKLAALRAIAYAKTVMALGELEGLTLGELSYFLKQLANLRWKKINPTKEPLFADVDEIVQLEWVSSLFRGSLDNFFETAGTNYQIGALVGDWEYPDENYMKDSDLEKFLQEN